MMKKICVCLMFIAVCLCLCPPAYAAAFTDVKDSDYFADAVAWGVEKGIVNGTSATEFSPDQDCTEAEILTFIHRYAGSPEASSSISVPGVQAGSFYAGAVAWAWEQEIAGGTSFDAQTPCTRSTAVEYLWRMAGSPAAEKAGFTDVPSDASYAQAVAWAVKEGITTGSSATTFSPSSICSRGQIITFLYRAASDEPVGLANNETDPRGTSAQAVEPPTIADVDTIAEGHAFTLTWWSNAGPDATYDCEIYSDPNYTKEAFPARNVKHGYAFYFDTSITRGSTYYARVRAVRGDDVSPWECQMVKIPYASSPGQDRRPDAPDALQVSAVSEDSAQMTWDDRGYSQCYEVRMYADAGYQTITQTLSRKAREYVTLNDLKVGETRYMGIRTAKSVDSSMVSYSDWVNFSYTHTGKPAAPIRIKAIESEFGEAARVTWEPIPSAAGYEVCLYTDASFTKTEEVHFCKAGKAEFNLGKLSPGARRHIGVRTVRSGADGNVYSDWMNFSYTHGSGVSGGPPWNIRTVSSGENKAKTIWTATGLGITSDVWYEICQYTDHTYTKQVNSAKAKSGPYEWTGLKAGTTYYFGIRQAEPADGYPGVVDYSGWTNFSYTHTVNPTPDRPNTPVPLRMVSAGEDQALLVWTLPPRAATLENLPTSSVFELCEFTDSTCTEIVEGSVRTCPTDDGNYLFLSGLKAKSTHYYGLRVIETVKGKLHYSDWATFSYTHK